MKFAYAIEDCTGHVVLTYQCEAVFTPEDDGFTSGRPERCRSASGGDLDHVTVYLDDMDVTENLTDTTYLKICDYARQRRR